MKFPITKILSEKFKGLEWVSNGLNLEDFTAVNGSVLPSVEELKVADLALQSEEYKDLRADEYPTIAELVVALIEDKEGRPQSLNNLLAIRAAIKAKYPKGQ